MLGRSHLRGIRLKTFQALLPAMAAAAAITFGAPLAQAAASYELGPYGQLAEGSVLGTPLAAGDSLVVRGDHGAALDGALSWSAMFSLESGVGAMRGEATFAVPSAAYGIADGISDYGLGLYRLTGDEAAQGARGTLVQSFVNRASPTSSWAQMDLAMPFGGGQPGSFYALVFEGLSVANPYFEAHLQFDGGTKTPDAVLTPVPEPSSAALAGAGALLLVAALRRQRAGVSSR